MWRLAVLRCLIALNWTVAGLASMQVVYGHLHLWHTQSYRCAHEQLAHDAPDLVMGQEEHWRRSAVLSDEYKARTIIVANSGWWGWWTAMVAGAATAFGLMIVFPNVQAAAQRYADSSTTANRGRI